MKFLSIITAFLAPAAAVAAAVSNTVDGGDLIRIMASKKGRLYVKLNHASNLRDKDWIGQSDPYVEMWLEKAYKQRSKDNKGLNPVYDETFCFYVRPGQNKLYVRAVDKDTFNNDKIGDTSISLDQVLSSGQAPAQDYNLSKWFGLRSDGSVNLQMQFVEDKSA